MPLYLAFFNLAGLLIPPNRLIMTLRVHFSHEETFITREEA